MTVSGTSGFLEKKDMGLTAQLRRRGVMGGFVET